MPPWPKWMRCSAMPKSSNADSYADFGVGGAERVRVNDIMTVRETAPPDGGLVSTAARAPSCRCRMAATIAAPSASFPIGRGQFAQRAAMGAVVAEARRLVEKGFAEIVLTGVDLTSYGADLPGTPTLGALVRKLLKLVPELKRLRLSSIDSIEADADLMRAIAEEERLMPHFHLSAQSGDDMILKRMKRRHTRADTIAFCDDGAPPAPRCRLRRRPDRGLSHRNRGDVREQPEAGGRCGASDPACLPFQPAQGHAGRAHAAAGPRRWSRNAPPGCAPRATAALAARLRSPGRQRARRCWWKSGGIGRTPCFAPVALEGAASTRRPSLALAITGRDRRPSDRGIAA